MRRPSELRADIERGNADIRATGRAVSIGAASDFGGVGV